MSPGWFYLAAMIAAYGVANLLQSMAAARNAWGKEMGDALHAFTQQHLDREMRSLRVLRRVNESLPAVSYDPS